MTNDDIVTWLRSILHNDRSVELRCQEAANEIERLRTIIEGWYHSSRNADRDIAELTAERDEARRMWCQAAPVGNFLSVDDMDRRARAEAKRRGWDCFKEDTNG